MSPIVAFVHFLDQKKMVFYKDLLRQSPREWKISIFCSNPDVTVLKGELGKIRPDAEVMSMNGPTGFIHEEQIKKECHSAEAVFFDDLSYEMFFKYFVYTARLGKAVIVLGKVLPSLFQDGRNSFVLKEYKAAAFLGLVGEIKGMAPDKRSRTLQEIQALGNEIHDGIIYQERKKPQPTPKNQGAKRSNLFIFYDSHIEEKNQRYYRHQEYLQKNLINLWSFGINFSQFFDWKPLLGDEPTELDGEESADKNRIIGIPFNNLNLSVLDRALPFIAHFMNSVLFYFGILKVSKKQKFDLCFANSAWAGLTGVFLKKNGLVKFLVYEDLDYYPGFYNERTTVWYMKRIEKIILDNADIVSCVSQELVTLRKLQTRNPIIHSSNGVDTSIFRGRPDGQIHPNTIIYTGTLDKWSGLDMVIEAVSRLKSEMGDIKLVIIGKDWKDNFFNMEMVPLIKKYELEDTVQLLGSKKYSELPEFLSRATIGVIPNRPIDLRRYSCPLKLFDYAACGLPIVCTDIGEMGGLVKNNSLGKAVAFDADSYFNAFKEILADKELRKKFRENCLGFSEKYDWENIFGLELAQIRERAGSIEPKN